MPNNQMFLKGHCTTKKMLLYSFSRHIFFNLYGVFVNKEDLFWNHVNLECTQWHLMYGDKEHAFPDRKGQEEMSAPVLFPVNICCHHCLTPGWGRCHPDGTRRCRRKQANIWWNRWQKSASDRTEVSRLQTVKEKDFEMELITQSGKESKVTDSNTKVIDIEGGLPLFCVSLE